MLTPLNIKEELENQITNVFTVPEYVETVLKLAKQLQKAHELLDVIGSEYHGWKDIEEYFENCDPIIKEWTK